MTSGTASFINLGLNQELLEFGPDFAYPRMERCNLKVSAFLIFFVCSCQQSWVWCACPALYKNLVILSKAMKWET